MVRINSVISSGKIHRASEHLLKVLVFKALILILIAIFAVSVPFNRASAAALVAFGGKIIWTTWCINGIAITVGPPKPGQYFMVWGNQRYQYYIPKPGSSIKGTAFPVYIPCYEGLVVLPGGLLIAQWGSSLK